jgi:hypothetical protein
MAYVTTSGVERAGPRLSDLLRMASPGYHAVDNAGGRILTGAAKRQANQSLLQRMQHTLRAMEKTPNSFTREIPKLRANIADFRRQHEL